MIVSQLNRQVIVAEASSNPWLNLPFKQMQSMNTDDSLFFFGFTTDKSVVRVFPFINKIWIENYFVEYIWRNQQLIIIIQGSITT